MAAVDPRSSAEEAKRDIMEASNVIRDERSIGGLTTFNIEHGYLEAMLRGFKSGFLKSYEVRQHTATTAHRERDENQHAACESACAHLLPSLAVCVC